MIYVSDRMPDGDAFHMIIIIEKDRTGRLHPFTKTNQTN